MQNSHTNTPRLPTGLRARNNRLSSAQPPIRRRRPRRRRLASSRPRFRCPRFPSRSQRWLPRLLSKKPPHPLPLPVSPHRQHTHRALAYAHLPIQAKHEIQIEEGVDKKRKAVKDAAKAAAEKKLAAKRAAAKVATAKAEAEVNRIPPLPLIFPAVHDSNVSCTARLSFLKRGFQEIVLAALFPSYPGLSLCPANFEESHVASGPEERVLHRFHFSGIHLLTITTRTAKTTTTTSTSLLTSVAFIFCMMFRPRRHPRLTSKRYRRCRAPTR